MTELIKRIARYIEMCAGTKAQWSETKDDESLSSSSSLGLVCLFRAHYENSDAPKWMCEGVERVSEKKHMFCGAGTTPEDAVRDALRNLRENLKPGPRDLWGGVKT